jgi:hypothetical protein
MKKVALIMPLLCIMLLTACAPQIVRQGGVVVYGDARETAGYLSYYAEETVVYVTKSGEKYHIADCSYLTDSAMPVSLEQAVAEGKQPCSRCHPDEG